jgi:hypothetical protein
MITLKEWMEVVDYRITEGSDYYGYEGNAYCLDSWNGEHNGHSFSIVFDTKTQAVYKVEVHDYANKRSYRRLNETVEHDAEKQAYDDVNFVDLDVDDDWIQKALAIREGEEYDSRVSVPLDIPDSDLILYFKAAHERDMTFNEFVEEALRHAINEAEKDPEAFKARFEAWSKK